MSGAGFLFFVFIVLFSSIGSSETSFRLIHFRRILEATFLFSNFTAKFAFKREITVGYGKSGELFVFP